MKMPRPGKTFLIMLLASSVAAFAVGCMDDTPFPDLPVANPRLQPPEYLSDWRDFAINAVIEGRVLQGARSGFVVLVARDGRLIHASTSGHRDIEAGLPMTMDTRFQIASMTKPVIAVAAMILVEEGKLDLEDPVSKFIPGIADMRVATLDAEGNQTGAVAQEPAMRLRHVLSFASGIGPGFDPGPLQQRWLDEGLDSGSGSLATRIERIAALPLFEQPGTRWRYGDAFDVLARIVEIAAGEPLELFLQRRIFNPLGMKDTTYLRDMPEDAPLAVMYRKNDDGDLAVQTEQKFRPDDWTPGGTGLVSTAPDYMRFAMMLWNEGKFAGVRIIQPETVKRMQQPEIDGVLSFIGMEGLSFGLGVSVVTDQEKTMMTTRNGDFWWSGAYGTHLWISPSTGIVLVVMQQQSMDMDPQGDAPVTPFIVQGLALVD